MSGAAPLQGALGTPGWGAGADAQRTARAPGPGGAERACGGWRAPDEVPVTMASFLSPNLALFCAAFCMPCSEGILKPASCSKPSALPARHDARTRRLKRGISAGGRQGRRSQEAARGSWQAFLHDVLQ